MAKAKKSTKKRTTRVRRTRRPAAKKARNRASATAKEAAAGRTPGPSIPLRDLIRGGMPRSSKAHHAAGVAAAGPQVRRRMKSAHGLRMGGGGIAQNVPRPLEHVGSLRMAIPKR